MAARRIAKSSVDWAAFAERVPPNQRECFKAFKAKSEMFVSRVHKYPEALPKLDFAAYKAQLPNAAMVDEFQKNFETLKVPYPTDKDNILGQIDQSEKEAKKKSEEYVANLKSVIVNLQAELEAIDLLPPCEKMTYQMYVEYFPDDAITSETESFWPHDKKSQPQHDPDTLH